MTYAFCGLTQFYTVVPRVLMVLETTVFLFVFRAMDGKVLKWTLRPLHNHGSGG